MKNLTKNIIIVCLVLVSLSGLFNLFSGNLEPKKDIPLTQLAQDINQEKVDKVTVLGSSLEIVYRDNSKAISRKENEIALSQSLLNYGVDKDKLTKLSIETKQEGGIWTWLGPLLTIVLPLLIFGYFFWSMLGQAKTGAIQALNFSRAKAKIFGAEGQVKERVTFKDVAGLEEAKEELKEVVEFLKTPQRFLKMGARIPHGVLLVGPPGTGKTLLARAVASEAGVPFLSIAGSEFVELFVGVGSSRVRDLFQTAKKAGTAIIFIDELDAIGRTRGVGIGGGHDEREQTLNQILVEMDGFEKNSSVIIFAATNRPDVLDPALLRPGRFDRRVILDLPDVKDREQALKIHCEGKPLAKDINFREVAERTPGFSGADLANLANEAAILATRRNRTNVSQTELLESIEKVLLGPERKSHILSKQEKKIAAYHEAGHALVSTMIPGTEPIRKISIIARGMAAGYTLKVPTEERRLRSKTEFLGELSVLLGGYCAEKLVFKEITTGASNDLERASELSRRLVKDYGMSNLGPVTFGEDDEMNFLGKEVSGPRNYSEKVATAIDREVERFMRAAEARATVLLIKNRVMLNRIADTLTEKETIEREEYEEIIKNGTRGKLPVKPTPKDDSQSPPPNKTLKVKHLA